jgi:hypothetical protein
MYLKNDLEMVRGDPRQILCNVSALGRFVRASDKVLEQTSELLCKSSNGQVLGLINSTALLNEVI